MRHTLKRSSGAMLRHGRGFSLVELSASLAILSIIVAMVSSVVLLHTGTFLERRADIATEQAAQDIVSLLQTMSARVGYGYGHGPGAVGVATIGPCGGDTPPNPYAPISKLCRGVDNGGANDRLRMNYIDPWLLFYGHSQVSTAGPCPGGSGQDPSVLHIPAGAATAYTSYLPAFTGGIGVNISIGGSCTGGPAQSAGTTEFTPTNAVNAGNGCAEMRTFLTTPPDSSQALACANGFDPGWTMGIAEKIELFSQPDPTTGVMTLMMSQQSWGPNVWPVATGVTRFEVRYAIDLDDTPTGKMGLCPTCTDDPYQGALGATYAWCRDLRSPSSGGNCQLFLTPSGMALGDVDLYSRVVAIHVSFDLTRTVRTGGYLGGIANSNQQRVTSFQALFGLRNMQPQ